VCGVCVCARECVCARACVLGLCISANVCVCVCVCACVRCFVHVHTICGTSLYRPKERPELSVAFEYDPWTSFYNYMTTLGEKANEKRICEFFLPVVHLLWPFFVGIRAVRERVSGRIEKIPRVA